MQLTVRRSRAPLELRAFVLNGSTPGGLLFYLYQANGGVTVAFEGERKPSDDPDFGSMLEVSIPPELRRPGGLDHVITDIDVLLHANAGGPYVAITGCPPTPPGFKTMVFFDQAAPGATVPLATTATASWLAGPPPDVTPMPAFGLQVQRKRGEIRRLRAHRGQDQGRLPGRRRRGAGVPGRAVTVSGPLTASCARRSARTPRSPRP
jgi:hypothetical protein